MEDIVSRYKNGDSDAREELLEDIMSLHRYTINLTEATILLHKKYGKVKTVW